MKRRPVPLVSSKLTPDERAVEFAVSISRMHLLEDDNRAKAIAAQGARRPGLLACWAKLLWELNPRHIFDVGANHGEMSLPLLLRDQQTLHLFEPNPHMCRLLRKSARSHIQWAQIQVSDCALSDADGSTTLFVDRKWSGTSALDYAAEDAAFKGEGDQVTEEVTVETRTLDSYFLERCRRTVDPRDLLAMKLDVEGHEPRVLAGAAELLKRPVLIQTEYSAHNLKRAGSSATGYFETLREIGPVFSVTKSGHAIGVEESKPAFRFAELLVTNDPTVLRMIRSIG